MNPVYVPDINYVQLQHEHVNLAIVLELSAKENMKIEACPKWFVREVYENMIDRSSDGLTLTLILPDR